MSPTSSRGHAPILALASALAVAALPGVSAAKTAPSSGAGPTRADAGQVEHYVALGDSFTSGPFISPMESDPVFCLRSENNYPNVVADALDVAEFDDVSCAMAETEHMTEPQSLGIGPTNPAQFDALRADTSLVTLGIGGNDLGFLEVLLKCSALSATNPTGAPCREHFAGDGGDELRERLPEVGEDIAAALAGIRERSPEATIAVVGYLQVLPEERGCWPRVPIARGDVAYLDETQTALNAEIEKRAADAGVAYVDVFERGHDVCAEPAERWVEGIFPDQPAAPAHPNKAGMAETGTRVLAALRDAEPAPLP
ncbi:lysophospholipase L1-like esterase [Lipingzhangella halophila]|uniref:Lysophospholipase L1-like esterase n=1 Tax=Lipingzhangella halophila TaxID=1783352 RepID=A0A7W7VZW9_9ACTN|nr:SGNH/GDSL hydrolase family protein [Lipingzhangella halophila]MBB4929277.1 lysophospholipase L1-like esterase [Lipingzhangella halophila]